MKTEILKKEIIDIKGKKREFTLREVSKKHFIVCDSTGLVFSEHKFKMLTNDFKKHIKSLNK